MKSSTIGVAVFCLASLRTKGRVALLLLAMLIGVAAGRVEAQGVGGQDEGSGTGGRLRVLTYNIHHAEGVDGKLDLPRIAQVIRESQADVVALQEVDVHVARSQDVDQATELARMLGFHHHFGRSIDLGEGEYGNAILSRWEIESARVIPWPNHDAGEQRTVLWSEIKTPLGEVVFLATHWDHRRDPAERLACVKRLEELVAGETRPLILAGDLNATYYSQVVRQVTANWQVPTLAPMPTIPVDQPQRQIDFVLTRNMPQLRLFEVKVIDEPIASDHRPLVLELTFDAASETQ